MNNDLRVIRVIKISFDRNYIYHNNCTILNYFIEMKLSTDGKRSYVTTLVLLINTVRFL